jgi:hypothetical protein
MWLWWEKQIHKFEQRLFSISPWTQQCWSFSFHSKRHKEVYIENLKSGKTVRKKKEKSIAEEKIKCPICPNSYEKLVSLSLHFRRLHHKTSKDLYVALNCNGVVPTCKCGCGTELTFLDITRGGFGDYILGHASRVHNNWGHNTAALEKSQAVRRENWHNGTYQVWSKGLTKETDERIKVKSEKNDNYSEQ